MRDYTRTWCAECQYPGLDKFTFGTVFADTIEAAHKEIERGLACVLPVLPKILSVIPGQIVFHPRHGEPE